MVDEEGNIVFKSLIDENGNFEFKKIPFRSQFLLKVETDEPELILLVYDRYGNVSSELVSIDDSGVFNFEKIKENSDAMPKPIPEGEENFDYVSQTVWGNLEYDKNGENMPEGIMINAYDENGNLVGTETTEEKGVFRFRNIPAQKSLTFELMTIDNKPLDDDFTLYIYDRNRQKVAGLKKSEDGVVGFRPLGYFTSNELSQIQEGNFDFTLKRGKENNNVTLVYFGFDQVMVKESDVLVLDDIFDMIMDEPDIMVEINAYTDAQSTDEYNLDLSQKRGQWIVDYFVKKGIDASHFIINAYGESRLVDERNGALNRRAEIHIY